MQRIFANGDSLEASVACERVAKLIAKTEKLINQSAFLRDERRRVRLAAELTEERKRALVLLQRGDFVPENIRRQAGERHVLINVGGLMFEAPVSVLCRDKGSLLAQLCGPTPPLLPDSEGGFFYFDRDWWLFRYILTFLRDGSLPEDRATLSQLYREANFWTLSELQQAVEEDKLHLRTKPLKEEEKDTWWRTQPSYWKALDEASRAAAEAAAAKAKPADWWTDTAYNGRTYLPLSTAADKVVTKDGEKDVKLTATQTWAVPLDGRDSRAALGSEQQQRAAMRW